MAVAPITKETELAIFAQNALIEMGYETRSELHHIDIVGRNSNNDAENEYIGVELKKTFNVDVIFQAVRTQKWTGHAVIVVPLFGTKMLKYKKQKQWTQICRALKIGLWVVEEGHASNKSEIDGFDNYASDTCVPNTPESRYTLRIIYSGERVSKGRLNKAITKEFNGRSADYNVGGSTRTALYTAFSEKYSRIARLHIDEAIKSNGVIPLKASEVKSKTQYEDAGALMYRNVHNWFHKCGAGYYSLNEGVLKHLDMIEKVTGPFDKDLMQKFLAKKVEAKSQAEEYSS